MNLKDKVCVITGSTRGIGFALACGFAKEGAKVVIVGTSENSTNNGVEKLKELVPNATAIGVPINVQITESVEEGFKQVAKVFGKIDILINNAGVDLNKGIEDITDGEYDKLMNINARGVFKCSREVIKYMKNGGSIINTSSINGINGASNQSVYSASKAAVIGLTKSLAKELGPRHIRVNAVAPGMIGTDMVKEMVSDELKERIIQMTPLRKMGEPKDLCGLYMFLASDASSFITGDVINIDGGLVL